MGRMIGVTGAAVLLSAFGASALVAQAADPAAVPAAAEAAPAPAPAPVVTEAPAVPVVASAAPAEAAAPKMIVGNIAPPPPGKGQVIFFRRGTIIGGGISCAVRENEVKVSSLPPGKYFVTITDPGIHNYTVQSEAKDTLRLEVEDGETYYSECTIGMGIMAGRPNLSPSSLEAFSARLPKLKPVVNKAK